MAYLIVTDKQQEIDRYDLSAPIVIGRSPECDVVVRDVLLSRRHMKLEPDASGWTLTDLGSKNGTFIDGKQVAESVLNDADVIRAGRTRFIFRAGAFVPPPPDVLQRKAARRPADPIEALSGTIMGFEMTDLEENSRITGFPIPRPKAVQKPQPQPAPPRRVRRQADLVKQPANAPQEWDLTLREPSSASQSDSRAASETRAPSPAFHSLESESAPEVTKLEPVIEPPAVAPISAAPRAPARATRVTSKVLASTPAMRLVAPDSTQTPRWLALTYVVVAYLLCALVLWLVSWS